MDQTAYRQKPLEAAILASLEGLQRQNKQSPSQVSPPCQSQNSVAQSALEFPNRRVFSNAQSSKMPKAASPQPSKSTSTQLVDLTNDSRSGSD
ncbi:hypothetical protein N7533_008259 [Penicillium manginii]|uniref:uncharacterized protein n=1 Tax=Penicillium manginii TaxID=203109 RepID=UPI002546FA94|nr:uncharacterized protein N7533_008259 [Penicillium manginii]KAJ5751231.1 hypothetical protein N7533_008259 [Penicillium manginii]